MPKIGICNFLGVQFFKGNPNILTDYNHVLSYLKKVYYPYTMPWECIEMTKFNYMLEIDISRNSSQENLGSLKGVFLGFGCPNDTHLTPC